MPHAGLNGQTASAAAGPGVAPGARARARRGGQFAGLGRDLRAPDGRSERVTMRYWSDGRRIGADPLRGWITLAGLEVDQFGRSLTPAPPPPRR